MQLGLLESLRQSLQGLMQKCPACHFLEVHEACLRAPLFAFPSAKDAGCAGALAGHAMRDLLYR